MPDTIKHQTCLESFNKFQNHWPFLHLHTFSISSNNHDGILLAIICVGGGIFGSYYEKPG
jgi:hypothetical protein